MNVIVIGAGEVGVSLLQMQTTMHKVTVVDVDAAALKRAADKADVQTVQGHATSYDTLKKAGAEDADLVCAVTSSDELNMLASLLARKMGSKRTVVRVHAAEHVATNEFFYKDVLGFDFTVSPEEMAAMQIVRLCRGQNAKPVENFAGGRLQMRRVAIEDDSPAIGRTLGDIKLSTSKVVCVGMMRGDGTVEMGRGETRIEAGDVAMLIGLPQGMEKASKALGARSTLPKKVIISGGGAIATLVCRDLEALGTSVLIIEPDEERAKQLADTVADGSVSVGEATDLDFLAQEGIKRADAFIALEQQDERNLLACQLAKKLGAKMTIALLNRSTYSGLTENLGITASVQPRKLAAKRIGEWMRNSDASSIARVGQGQAIVVDRMIPESWPHLGLRVRDISWPKDSVIGGIIRAQEAIVPRGDTVLEAQDHLLVFVKDDSREELHELLHARRAEPSGDTPPEDAAEG